VGAWMLPFLSRGTSPITGTRPAELDIHYIRCITIPSSYNTVDTKRRSTVNR